MESQPNQIPQGKQRHGCLWALLIFMFITNILGLCSYVFMGDAILRGNPKMPEWSLFIYIALGLANLACCLAIFFWKKWGFVGFAVVSILALILNLFVAGLGILSSLSGMLGLLLLYGTLQIGKTNKGWTQLE